MSRPTLRVAYVLRAFPRLSETFILGEILALQRHGVGVGIYALEEVRESRRHPEVERLLPTVTWVPRAPKGAGADSPAPAGMREWWSAGEWIGRRLLDSDVQHVHAHYAGPAATAAAAAAATAGLPFTFTAHAKDIFVHSVDWDWVGVLARRARAVVTVCEFNRRYLKARLPAGTRIVRIRNGVDLDRWRPSRAAPTRNRILGVGRLVPKKGFDVLIEAIALLVRAGVEVSARIAGEGVERPRLEGLIRAHRLGRRVWLIGTRPRPALRRLVRRAVVVALPSVVTPDGNSDALPTVLLEAGACAVPVVSTRVAGIPEIVRHGVTGLLVPPGDVAALARALRRVLTVPRLRQRLGRQARLRIERHFDQACSVAALARLFGAPALTDRPELTSHAHRAALS